MTEEWRRRHSAAMVNPLPGHEEAIVGLYECLDQYAEAHQDRFESPIGEDYVLGGEWKAIAQALIGLLNGETARLDCGTLDGAIRKMATLHDVELDQ